MSDDVPKCYNASDVHRTYIADTCFAIILNALVFEQKYASATLLHSSHSCYSRLRHNKQHVSTLAPYASAATGAMPMVRCKALLCLAHASTEHECQGVALLGARSTLKYLVRLLEDAAGQTGHLGKWYPFSAKELLSGINKLAQNDQNKRTFVTLGVLPIYTKLLKEPLDNEELVLTLEGLWSFSFLSMNRSEMHADTELIEALKSYQKHVKNGDILKPVKGTLFMLNYGNALGPDISAENGLQAAGLEDLKEPAEFQSKKRLKRGEKKKKKGQFSIDDKAVPSAPTLPPAPATASPPAPPKCKPGKPAKVDKADGFSELHGRFDDLGPGLEKEESGGHSVMISYQWQYKPLVLKINEFLKTNGITTWIDVENMSGSLLEAMADAIEKASIVLICYSESYKMSSSCRTEAEYTYKLRKAIVPVRAQPKYIADGWLGILLGNKLYFDLSTDQKYKNNCDGLARQLKELLSGGNSARDMDTIHLPKPNPRTANQVGILKTPNIRQSIDSIAASECSTIQTSPLDRVKTWDSSKVIQWLGENQLQQLSNTLPGLSGSDLVTLHDMLQSAPNEYYQSMRTHLHGQPDALPSMLKFTTALRELAQ